MPDSLEQLSHEDLIEEYTSTTQHLTICDIHGQIDIQQQNEQEVLKQELLQRMSKEQ